MCKEIVAFKKLTRSHAPILWFCFSHKPHFESFCIVSSSTPSAIFAVASKAPSILILISWWLRAQWFYPFNLIHSIVLYVVFALSDDSCSSVRSWTPCYSEQVVHWIFFKGICQKLKISTRDRRVVCVCKCAWEAMRPATPTNQNPTTPTNSTTPTTLTTLQPCNLQTYPTHPTTILLCGAFAFDIARILWAVNNLANLWGYSSIPAHRNHQNDPASVFLSTHWWSQHPASQRWLFLVVSCFFKPLRNCHPSQRVSKVQCKKPAKKNISILRFYVGFFKRFNVFWRDFMLIFY